MNQGLVLLAALVELGVLLATLTWLVLHTRRP
jgi:hypothetical protein